MSRALAVFSSSLSSAPSEGPYAIVELTSSSKLRIFQPPTMANVTHEKCRYQFCLT
jgi:hypothetical protein